MTWSTATEYLCIKWPRICYICRNHNPVISSFMSYYSICNKSNTTDASSGAGTAFPSGAPKLTTIYLGYCVFCHSWYLFDDWYLQIFFSTFWNILRKKYIRKLVYQDYKNCINVCTSVCAWSIWKSPNRTIIAETS